MLALFEQQVADQELAKESASSDLIPAGKYPFLVMDGSIVETKESFENKDKDGNVTIVPNPLHGHQVARLKVQLFGVSAKGYDALDGTNRTTFFNVCFDSVKDAKNKLKKESKLAGDMISVSGLAGQTANDVINWFTSNKGIVSIGKFDGSNGPMNTTYGITKLEA